ncbi:uncharacterized protein BDZ99DRAFT_514036 [Mytilinidion resinicola]|uniref:F-box domain-containing protein n=1 Tax=Mytilinidion resinicola TaxID=574789 RepID=A0A6A6Z9V8_9PEZI|nr:uncharacterized protein BDZ99DRAFT_514036 [Mytilinidion resinicola]KAF2817820.1 hypothetical protein BDZ99DRAFT_514036 [Mytilinidion resinicola]
MATTQPNRLVEFLTNLDNGYEIFESITRQLSPMDLVNLRQTSRDLQTACETVVATQWSINKALRKFVKDPTAFRNTMSLEHSVISGDFALRFFDRAAPGNVLDLWTNTEVRGSRMEKCLLEEGYKADNDQLVLGKTGEWEVYDIIFTRPSHRGDGPKIHFHMCRALPTLHILRGYQECTALANIITSTKAYAPFANLTFTKHRSYVLYPDREYPRIGIKQFSPSFLAIVNKSGRPNVDVTLVDERRLTTASGNRAPEMRSLSDSQTWTIPLDPEGITPDFVTDASEFSISTAQICCLYRSDVVEAKDRWVPRTRNPWVFLAGPKHDFIAR